MQINRISIFKPNTIINYPPKNSNTPIKEQPAFKGENNINSNAYLYHAPYFIQVKKQPEIVSKIKLINGKSQFIQLDGDFVKKYIMSQGQINQKEVFKFLGLYQAVLNDFISRIDEENKFLESVMEEKDSKVISLNPDDELEIGEQLAQMRLFGSSVNNIFKDINDSCVRKQLAKEILETNDADINNLVDFAHDTVITLYKICQKTNDFSPEGIKKNLELANKAEELQNNFPSEFNILDEILKYSKTDNNNYDIDYAVKLSDYLMNIDVYDPGIMNKIIKSRNRVLRKFMNKDINNSNKIAQSIIKLSSELKIDYYNETHDFENIFNFSFNPKTKKFEEERFQNLLDFIPSVILKAEQKFYEEELEIEENDDDTLFNDFIKRKNEFITSNIENHFKGKREE